LLLSRNFAAGLDNAIKITGDRAREKLIYELGNMFAAHLGLEELTPLVISKCREVLNANGVSVLLLDRERNELYFPYVSEDDPEVARRLSGLRSRDRRDYVLLAPAPRSGASTPANSGHDSWASWLSFTFPTPPLSTKPYR
jgi:hypothetical protein